MLFSTKEGLPLSLIESTMFGKPILCNDVGDVKEIIGNTQGCYITSFDPKEIAEKIKMALDFVERTNGRENVKHLEINIIAKRIIEVYKEVINGQ